MSKNLWTLPSNWGQIGKLLPWLDRDQNSRREFLRVHRMLFCGEHRTVFLDECRTQFDWPEARVLGRIMRPYVSYNVLKLISTTNADLLVGEEPVFRADDAASQQVVDDLVKRCDLHRIIYDAARTASWAREAVVETIRWEGEVYVRDLPVDEVYPIGPVQPDGQFAKYERHAVSDDGKLLLVTTWTAGAIDRACYVLTDKGRGNAVDIARWPTPDNVALAEREKTGVPWPTIAWLANEISECIPTSDYSRDLIELQDELNAKQTQIARVIAKHSDPKMAVPQSMADENGNIRANHEVFFTANSTEIPAYVTWNAELSAAVTDRDFTLSAICTASEMSAVLLGIKQGATPDSARKVRLEATKSLSRAKRKAATFRPWVRMILETALAMDASAKAVRPEYGTISIELRDGLPEDGQDLAQEIATLKSVNGISLERMVSMQIPDPVQAEQEVKLIRAGLAAEMPSVFGADMGTSHVHSDAQQMSDTTSGDEASNTDQSTVDPSSPDGSDATGQTSDAGLVTDTGVVNTAVAAKGSLTGVQINAARDIARDLRDMIAGPVFAATSLRGLGYSDADVAEIVAEAQQMGPVPPAASNVEPSTAQPSNAGGV